MRAELKGLHSPDADLRIFTPSRPDNFGLLVQAMIGFEGSDASESFDVIVCSPAWLHDQCLKTGSGIFGTHHLVMNDFDYGRIESMLSQLCKSTEGRDWNELAMKLSCYGAWEFGSYVPYSE